MKVNNGSYVRFKVRERDTFSHYGQVVKVKDFKEHGSHYNISSAGMIFSVPEACIIQVVEHWPGVDV